MYWLCMIATIPLATGNKLNCFISTSGMLAIVWHCVLLFCCFFVCVFLLIFYMLINHLLKKKRCSSEVSCFGLDFGYKLWNVCNSKGYPLSGQRGNC